ncbi:MAG: ATP-binding protein, partial [Methylococcaceae bacterium]
DKVLRFAKKELDVLARQKSIQIQTRCQAHPAVKGHPHMLEVMVRNLLDNAVRYTPAGGQVHAAAEDTPTGVRLVVEDSGPGIPEPARGQVFQRFYRHLETARQQSGSGLGLSIVERIAKLHGATVDLQTSPLGGLKVVVGFPGPSHAMP